MKRSRDDYPLPVVGVSFHVENLESLAGPATTHPRRVQKNAMLILEDDNPHDANAVRVDIEGLTVGHLSRADAVRFRELYGRWGRKGVPCDAIIISFQGDAACDYGVRLDLDL